MMPGLNQILCWIQLSIGRMERAGEYAGRRYYHKVFEFGFYHASGSITLPNNIFITSINVTCLALN